MRLWGERKATGSRQLDALPGLIANQLKLIDRPSIVRNLATTVIFICVHF